MRGAPVIQAVIIAAMLSLLGFAGMNFIQSGVYGMPDDSAHGHSHAELSLETGEIPVEIECYFSDRPESYSLLRPSTEEGSSEAGNLISKSSGIEENPVFLDVVLKGKADNVLWLNVTWADEKPHGNYFVQLIIHVGNEEPLTRTYRSSTNSLQGTIELDLSNFKNDDQ